MRWLSNKPVMCVMCACACVAPVGHVLLNDSDRQQWLSLQTTCVCVWCVFYCCLGVLTLGTGVKGYMGTWVLYGLGFGCVSTRCMHYGRHLSWALASAIGCL